MQDRQTPSTKYGVPSARYGKGKIAGGISKVSITDKNDWRSEASSLFLSLSLSLSLYQGSHFLAKNNVTARITRVHSTPRDEECCTRTPHARPNCKGNHRLVSDVPNDHHYWRFVKQNKGLACLLDSFYYEEGGYPPFGEPERGILKEILHDYLPTVLLRVP
jgi:hypothetical protein